MLLHILASVLGLQLPIRFRILCRLKHSGVEVALLHPLLMVLPELPVLLLSRPLNLLGVGGDLHHGQQNPAVPVAQYLLTGGNQLEAGVLRELWAGDTAVGTVFTPQDRVEEDEPATHDQHPRSKVKEVMDALCKAVWRGGWDVVIPFFVRDRVRSFDSFYDLPTTRLTATSTDSIWWVTNNCIEHLIGNKQRYFQFRQWKKQVLR